jgi:hypothetical protein
MRKTMAILLVSISVSEPNGLLGEQPAASVKWSVAKWGFSHTIVPEYKGMKSISQEFGETI